MAQEGSEREVVTDLLESYRELPCLWDISCESYKDSSQKKKGWDILAKKLQIIDPTANAVTAKKKIDNLRISYTREYKKVKESKNLTGSSASDIHKPSLWYYDLLSFLEKKNDQKRRGTDSLISDDEDEQQLGGTKRKKITRERNIEMKKEKLIDAANNLLTDRAETNAFGVYVGKKIDEIPLGQQRDLAEKLISDILFLAKTNNLTFNTRIENPSRTNHYPSQNSSESYFLQSNPFSASHTQYQSPASSHSYLESQLVNTSTPNYPIPTQSPTPPFFQSPAYSTFHTQPRNSSTPKCPTPIQSPTSSYPQHQSPASPHSYLISEPVNSPTSNCPTPLQSPNVPSYHTQHQSPASSHSFQSLPNNSQITNSNSTPSSQNAINISENTVIYYVDGPAEEVLKEMLVFKKH